MTLVIAWLATLDVYLVRWKRGSSHVSFLKIALDLRFAAPF